MHSRQPSLTLRRRLVACALGISLLVVAPSGSSGSIAIQEHLATVEQVSLKVVNGIYGGTPGGLEASEFKQMMKDSAADELTRCEVPLADSSDQHLLVLLHRSTPSDRAPDVLVFSVIVEFTEPAVLRRAFTSNAESDEVRVTSWIRRKLVTTTPENALEDLQEAVKFSAHSFALAVSVAKHRYEGKEMSDCFGE